MDGLLASLFSTGDTLKRQLRGLLANPVGEAQQNLLSLGDTSRQHLQDLAASGGLGVLGSDPAYRQAAQNRVQASTVDAAMNAVTPLTVGKLNLLKLGNRELNALSESALREVPEDVLQKLIARQGKAGQATGHFRGEIARRNAVKELGLPAENTAADRAAAMGIENGWAHGSPNPTLRELRSSNIGAEGPGIYATDYLPESATYALQGEGATVYPLSVSRAKTANTGAGSEAYAAFKATDDAELFSAMQAAGVDSLTALQPATPQWLVNAGAPYMPQRRHFVSQNPANFRSRFAAFDPAQRNSPNLLASYSPLGLLTLGGLLGGYNED